MNLLDTIKFYRIKIDEPRPNVKHYSVESRGLFKRWKTIGGRFNSEAEAKKFAINDFRHKPVKYKKIKI